MATVGELLRQWRHRRQLSQLDLSIAADVSARHVSLVETGKSQPSAEMVLRLAEQLDVPLRERNALLLAAGFAPRYAESSLDSTALSMARAAVDRVLLAHEPYPAIAFDRYWDVVLTNRAVAPFLTGVAPELLQPMNLIRLGLDPRGLAPLVANLDDVRSVFRARVRRQLAAAPNPRLTALYAELLADGDTGEPIEAEVVIPMIIRFDGAELRVFSTITTFGTPLDITLADLAVESYYPADAATAEYFET
ncbi:helix-turn-helix transcriptional regulator [Kribbella albertanoniae]|uniref:XRE family transcriptional regulator n=1 Tax=Kribbella albertanoniae TaxID=1266829 RepID=A0A4R4P2U2_9ACTN|nr:helix-turn-helix transcriptional regulator [Kribbella albertanoniae]TDC14927.1 XRE family transcriptional regulator [Kribbella albertanoniae]